tara:strand:+ start:30595 stop:30930 length:336 start_codon:yes stop_codon:yes gene_type:complete
MSNHRDKTALFDNPRNVRRVVQGLTALCVLLFGLDAVLPRHVEHPWEGVFGFYALYGFGACVLLVLLARELRKLVMRDSHYYPYDESHHNGTEPTSDKSTTKNADKRDTDD